MWNNITLLNCVFIISIRERVKKVVQDSKHGISGFSEFRNLFSRCKSWSRAKNLQIYFSQCKEFEPMLFAIGSLTASSYFSSQWLLMVSFFLFALKKFVCFQRQLTSQGCPSYNSNMWESDLLIKFDLFYLELPLVSIYKSFITLHFDYGGLIYYQGFYFFSPTCNVIYNVVLPITCKSLY